MPEGDAVFRTARRLREVLQDRPLTEAVVRWGSVQLPPLVGAGTLDVVPYGKHLLHRIEGGWTVHTHLRMDGRWQVLPQRRATTRRKNAPSVRVLMGTAQHACLGVQLGMVDVVRTEHESTLIGHLGPDILAEEWNLGDSVRRIRAKGGVTIAEALLDQTRIAGIGTLFCAEALFFHQLWPWTPVREVAEEAVSDVLTSARRLMRAACVQPVRTTTGRTDRGKTTYVHARSGRPCLRCGDTIRVSASGQSAETRTIFSCPTCQGGVGPWDDGAPQWPLGSSRRQVPRGYQRGR